ncbi:N-acetylmuramoyl-L-alanine amidase [Sporosarcina sp. 6E9]|uniref:N-acetylmuramoyl-L-alanine amidase n=1 Tax=Sporosarcina sp. 6E9 TaxID=2819235 RepID=UPI001FF0CA88|nr:N-acetylmuramoyl-L-alanine amidase [Sporosarcina sp. 6E9]
MAGLLNIPKFVDFRSRVKRHPTRKFPVLSLKGKTTIAIHHSLTRRGLAGSNAESYSRYHVDTHGWPSIGYNYVIEPDGTIKFCNNIELRTYHVGNHNNYCVGICLTGDFRYEEPTEEQKVSLRNLVNALKKEYTHLKYVKGHNEFSGYEWKPCPVFDFRKVLSEKGTVIKASALPNQYTIQQGDTFWSIAKGLKLTVDDLNKANPGVEPTQLQIGQKINLGKTTSKPSPKPAPKPQAKKNTVHLPKSAKTWRTYKLNVQPVAANSDWSLTPSAFGGLTYDILGRPYPNVVTINTGRGKRNIYVGPGTGAVIK